jgi:ribosomal protein L11 methyltransferase
LIKASSAEGDNQFDIILANIIKNVILDNLTAFVKQLTPNGIILFSGLLQDDEEDILKSANNKKLKLKKKIEVEKWICMKMIYESNIM